MNKRGVTENMLYDMFKTLISVFLFVILAGITWKLAFQKELTTAQRSLDTVAQEIAALDPNERFEIPSSGGNYALLLFSANNDEKRCANQPCVCAVERPEGKPEQWYCKTFTDTVEDCSKGFCAPPKAAIKVDVTKDAPIVVCRKGTTGNELFIGDACG